LIELHVLRPIALDTKIGHFGNVCPRQSLG